MIIIGMLSAILSSAHLDRHSEIISEKMISLEESVEMSLSFTCAKQNGRDGYFLFQKQDSII